MMVRVYGKCAFECDGCGETTDTNDTDLAEALATIRTAGWEHRRGRDGWEHYCPNCELKVA